MKILVYTANLGNFESNPLDLVSQSTTCDFYRFTDENFPPRKSSMTHRLQARICKMFGWQLRPGYDVYLWVDSSCQLYDKDSVKWFVEQLGDSDIAVFKHPNRNTIQEEADYLKLRLAKKCPYITPRYENEDIDGQLKVVNPKDELYASTAFIYRKSLRTALALEEWWYHTSRYHSIDQLSFTQAISSLKVKVMQENYLKNPYLRYVR